MNLLQKHCRTWEMTLEMIAMLNLEPSGLMLLKKILTLKLQLCKLFQLHPGPARQNHRVWSIKTTKTKNDFYHQATCATIGCNWWLQSPAVRGPSPCQLSLSEPFGKFGMRNLVFWNFAMHHHIHSAVHVCATNCCWKKCQDTSTQGRNNRNYIQSIYACSTQTDFNIGRHVPPVANDPLQKHVWYWMAWTSKSFCTLVQMNFGQRNWIRCSGQRPIYLGWSCTDGSYFSLWAQAMCRRIAILVLRLQPTLWNSYRGKQTCHGWCCQYNLTTPRGK